MNFFFNCHLSNEVRTGLEKFVLDNGYPSMMSFLSEAIWVYFEKPKLFSKAQAHIKIPTKEDKQCTISYNSDKYFHVTTQNIISSAKLNFRSASTEFSLFIHSLYYFIQENKTLPIPDYVTKQYSVEWLAEKLKKLREEKLVLEFYSLSKLMSDKGNHFIIDVDEFCNVIFLTSTPNYTYSKRIYQKLARLKEITGLRFKFNYRNLPEVEIRIIII